MVTHNPRQCPNCGSEQVMVYDSRSRDHYIIRRRKCMDCDNRFTSYEILESDYRYMRDFIRVVENMQQDVKALNNESSEVTADEELCGDA